MPVEFLVLFKIVFWICRQFLDVSLIVLWPLHDQYSVSAQQHDLLHVKYKIVHV